MMTQENIEALLASDDDENELCSQAKFDAPNGLDGNELASYWHKEAARYQHHAEVYRQALKVALDVR